MQNPSAEMWEFGAGSSGLRTTFPRASPVTWGNVGGVPRIPGIWCRVEGESNDPSDLQLNAGIVLGPSLVEAIGFEQVSQCGGVYTSPFALWTLKMLIGHCVQLRM